MLGIWSTNRGTTTPITGYSFLDNHLLEWLSKTTVISNQRNKKRDWVEKGKNVQSIFSTVLMSHKAKAIDINGVSVG